MKPIVLTLKGVKAAGLAAFNEGRLSAQGPTPDCRYRDASGLPCVVGAALTDEQATALKGAGDNKTSIWELVEVGKVKVRTPSADVKLSTLQRAHDRWAQAAGVLDHDLASVWKARTLRLLKAL